MALIDFLQHPLVLFALGCLVTYVIYHRQKNYRRLSYQRSDTFVIDPKIGQDDSLEVRFAGNTVPRVTQTVIRFWNSGTETIHGHDLSAIDPLRWQLPDGATYLSVNVDKTTREANAVTTTQDENRLLIKFDFLDRNDGATISVLHTAKASKTQINGIIKGGKVNDLGGAYDIPPRMPLSEDTDPKTANKWFSRCASLLIFAAFIGSIAITLSGIFPDYFLDTFPYFFSDAPNEPDLVRGRMNIGRTLAGLGFSAVFGLITFVIFENWKNKPPEKLRLDG